MIIVLVGSPLSGKTTLLKKLQDRGMKVFSADSYVKNIYKVGNDGYEVIKNNLGKEFVTDTEVNKRLLAQWASEEDNLNKLNELIHPLIFNYLEGKDGYIAELPIITNSPIKFNYDKLVLVKANDEVITNRFLKTNLRNPDFIKKILDDWNVEKIKFDYVVDSTNDIQENDIDNIIRLVNEK